VTKQASDATALGDVVKFLAQMVQMRTDTAVAQISGLLKGLNVTTEGNVVKVSLSIPEDQLEAFLNAADHHHKATTGRI
jgi:hypothetical protein